ncbi:MAG: anion transporter [Elusimicrobia bacterium]|nr:anion transporter [Elusimicrobiota bacterium]
MPGLPKTLTHALAAVHLRWIFIAVFACAYVLIAVENGVGTHINRAAAAFCGAVAMVLLGAVSLDQAYLCVDWNTILFLLGIMLLVAHFQISGFFEWVASRTASLARSRVELLVFLVFTSGLLSAFFVNDTICLVFAPVVLEITERLDLPAIPYLTALVTAANIGSAMSVTGNPQNAFIGITAHFSFFDFLVRMAPISLVGLSLDALILAFMFRKSLFGHPDLSRAAGKIKAPVDKTLLIKCALAAAVLAGLWAAGFSFPLAAAAVGALILVIGRVKTAEIHAQVDWELLLFFASLFILIQGFEASGATAIILRLVAPALKGSAGSRLMAAGGAMLVLSNLVSNVPAVILAHPVVQASGGNRLLWLAVAASSTLAGNLTPIGSMANLIVLEQAGEKAAIGFWRFVRVGALVTAATLIAALAVLALESRMGMI